MIGLITNIALAIAVVAVLAQMYLMLYHGMRSNQFVRRICLGVKAFALATFLFLGDTASMIGAIAWAIAEVAEALSMIDKDKWWKRSKATLSEKFRKMFALYVPKLAPVPTR